MTRTSFLGRSSHTKTLRPRHSNSPKSTQSFTSLSVLSGQYKGTKLLSPRLSTTHPMGSREKLALFNLLSGYLEGATVADLYAGSGALGFEAISRGAATVDFVENNQVSCHIIKQNLQNIQHAILSHSANARVPQNQPQASAKSLSSPAEPPTRLFSESVAQFLERPENLGRYQLVLADPPYDNFQLKEVVQISRLLQPGGRLALSYPARLDAPKLPNLTLIKDRHYAAAGIAIYEKSLSA